MNRRRAAARADVLQAIAENRLRVDVEAGTVATRRAATCSQWKAAKLEVVKGPHQRQGYFRFCFGTSAGTFRCLVHRAVWWTAGKEIPDGFEINHINGNKAINGAKNLELMTSGENIEHAFAQGLNHHARGRMAARGKAKLTDDQVRQIRASEEPQAELAELFGVTQGQVSRVRTRRTYSFVPDHHEVIGG